MVLERLQAFLKKHSLLLLLLFILLLLSIVFRSHSLYSWDSGQFALGTEYFSLAEHQPHPPGYFLFVQFGKLFGSIFHDVNSGFLMLNFLAGALSLIFFHNTAEKLSDRKTAFLLCLLFILNPVFWFYRAIALTYIFEILTSSFLLFTSVATIKDKKQWLPYAVFVVACIAGFRQSIIIVALPFLLVQFWYAQKKVKTFFISILFGILGILLWLPWFSHAVGGFGALSAITLDQLRIAKTTDVYNINHHVWLISSLLYTYHIPIILIALFFKRILRFIREHGLFFIPVIVLWQVGVYWLLHFGDVGYILSVFPLFYILLIPSILFLSQRIRILSFFFFAIAEICLFFVGAPFAHQHKMQEIRYTNIMRHDARIQNYIAYIQQHADEKTLIIALRGQYLNEDNVVASYPYNDIRILGYYLPEFRIYDLLGVGTLYNIAENYRYTKVESSTAFVSSDTSSIIFLADYIHPTFFPEGFTFLSTYPEIHPNNIYVADFQEEKSFHYNGITFIKN